jgi:hypothetical protein
MKLLGFDLLFWSPVYRDHASEQHARGYARHDDDIRIALRRPVFGVRRFESLRFIWRWAFWFGWLELRRRERAGAWCCPECEELHQREDRVCACGLVWRTE